MFRYAIVSISALLLVACGGGGGGGGDNPVNTPTPMLGDDARRAVLADIGNDIILPSLRDFDSRAATLATETGNWLNASSDAGALESARAAWRQAMSSWQRLEVLQIGPAARSEQMAGEDFRDLIYAYPQRNLSAIDTAACNDADVSSATAINTMGLGALEYLLFADAITACQETSATVQKRAQYASKIASFIAQTATSLRQRWEPAQGNFIATWSQAGAGSQVYMSPQEALNDLSIALFYVEKETKDRKIANPTGIGATGLPPCSNTSCPERVEFPYARTSLNALLINVQAFVDLFNGVNGMGVNDLLAGIDRTDIVTKLDGQLDALQRHLDTAISPDFQTAVAAIDDETACINAAANRSGEPACALHGLIKAATDTFRTEVVGALSLAVPGNAAGDND